MWATRPDRASRAGEHRVQAPRRGRARRGGSVTSTSTAHKHEILKEHKHGGLGELASTAICGNDITSSCLYVSGLAIIYAGRWAPVALLLVAGLLWMFRKIYAEVVGALPLNGGAYNALLNTTSKFRASVAACLTILSYMATAVISAIEAMHYVHHMHSGLPVMWATVGLLAFFAVLTIIGIAESAIVAILIFLFHMASLVLLLAVGGWFLFQNGLETFCSNMSTPSPDGIVKALFFGFCAALLGISGFESSSNFVEEQAEGVFPKTLRNMWGAVSFFNPAMALLVLAILPMALVPEPEYKNALLAKVGERTGGSWLSTLISIDAAFVLSGAVLTSFVGVSGLVRRMTLDRCLPQSLLKTNGRGTYHRILIGFFFLAVSVLWITGGELEVLAGVYTISFLAVMALFALGNMLLKVKRNRLPRPVRASWPTVLIAMAGVLLGLAGNAVMNPDYFRIFLQYFLPAMLIITIMLTRVSLLTGLYNAVRGMISKSGDPSSALATAIEKNIEEINSQQFVFFTRGDNLANLNQAVLYVRRNEHTNRMKIVMVLRPDEEVPERISKNIDFLDEAYPEVVLEFVTLEGKFGPELIQDLSRKWNIPTNFMFIGSPGDGFMYGLAELGGVRLII